MPSVTTWSRLEPLPKSNDLLAGLGAEIADPLWMIARQRQFGELRGEDAGYPIEARLTAESARISRYHPGIPGADAANVAVDHTDASLPLEALVEQEGARGRPGDGWLRVEAGLHFLRLLRKHRAAGNQPRYVTQYMIRDTDIVGDDADADSLRRAAVGRVPDGLRLMQDLRQARGSLPELTALPPQPAVPGADRSKVLAAANEYLGWWDRLIVEQAGDNRAWRPNRLEHAFAVQAEMPGGRVVLVADEYRGGRLDWHHFRAETRANLGSAQDAVPAEPTVRTVIPAPVSYGGMPADRFWEIEDATVRFGALTTGRTDLGRLLLSEFAITYGNDWFVIPVDLPVGSICDVSSLRVVDTFGEETPVQAARDLGSSSWTMFTLSAPNAPRRVQNLIFLPPVLEETLESSPFEEVAFFRDEMANVVWGVERVVTGGAGTAIDRYEEHQRSLAAGESQRVEVDSGDAELIYRLQSFVPDHWHPLVPVGAGGLQLERRPIIRFAADGTQTVVEPKGRVLRAATPLRVENEEISRGGAKVTIQFQLTRWVDGRTVVWLGRRKEMGKGEGSSGLRFDTIHSVAGISGPRTEEPQ